MDDLAIFATFPKLGQTTPPARYAIRQALNQEYQKYLACQSAKARQARYAAGGPSETQEYVDPLTRKGPETNDARDILPTTSKHDFFGRAILHAPSTAGETSVHGEVTSISDPAKGDGKRKVWISFHEGFSNAVRKPITLDELMRGF